MKLSLSLAALSLLAASPALAGGYGYGGEYEDYGYGGHGGTTVVVTKRVIYAPPPPVYHVRRVVYRSAPYPMHYGLHGYGGGYGYGVRRAYWGGGGGWGHRPHVGHHGFYGGRRGYHGGGW